MLLSYPTTHSLTRPQLTDHSEPADTANFREKEEEDLEAEKLQVQAILDREAAEALQALQISEELEREFEELEAILEQKFLTDPSLSSLGDRVLFPPLPGRQGPSPSNGAPVASSARSGGVGDHVDRPSPRN